MIESWQPRKIVLVEIFGLGGGFYHRAGDPQGKRRTHDAVFAFIKGPSASQAPDTYLSKKPSLRSTFPPN